MRAIRKSGSMSGKWKRSTAGLVRHRQTKAPETDRPRLNQRATSRLYFLSLPPRRHLPIVGQDDDDIGSVRLLGEIFRQTGVSCLGETECGEEDRRQVPA